MRINTNAETRLKMEQANLANKQRRDSKKNDTGCDCKNVKNGCVKEKK